MVDSEKVEFTKRAKQMLGVVAATHRVRRADFLNASEQSILEKMVANFNDVSVIFAGGFEFAERKRAIIFSTFMRAESIDKNVSIFRIEVIGKAKITHSQVLGSLMGLAIRRSVIGDIMVNSEGVFFASCSDFDEFFQDSFTKVGHHFIRLEKIEEVIECKQEFEELEIIVSSMRLDVVVKSLINVSRSKAEGYLEAGFVRLNHEVDKKAPRLCQIGDIISIRKYGRYKLIENKKTTKRGKFVVVVNKNV